MSGRHHHEHTDESIYILAGKARIEIDQEEALLTPGDSLTIPRGAVHQMFNVGQTPLEYLAICGPAWDFADQIDTVASI